MRFSLDCDEIPVTDPFITDSFCSIDDKIIGYLSGKGRSSVMFIDEEKDIMRFIKKMKN